MLWNRRFRGRNFPLLWNGMKRCHFPGVTNNANTRYMSQRPILCASGRHPPIHCCNEGCTKKAKQGGMHIASVELVIMASAAVLAAQHFPRKVTDWEGRPAIDCTWRAWKVEFRQAHIQRQHHYRHLEMANRLAELTPSSRHHPAPLIA